jgi:hypothetical protein
MVLHSEVNVRKALESLHHGMQLRVSEADWPALRSVLEMQATVWDSEGLHPGQVARIRAELTRIDAGMPNSQTGMLVLAGGA